MEYVIINESKLKVILDSYELQNKNLDAQDLDYADPYAKKLFGDILCYAKDNFGFDTSGHRVLLQLYPSKDGGCELFITKLGKLQKDKFKLGGDLCAPFALCACCKIAHSCDLVALALHIGQKNMLCQKPLNSVAVTERRVEFAC